MNWFTRVRPLAAPILSVAIVACSTGDDRAAGRERAAERGAQRSIELPDLGTAAPSVQAQLRTAHESLTKKVSDPSATDAALAAAYGEMGTLLMAAEFLDAAETSFLNAAALAPADARWPYYLAQIHVTRGESAKAAEFFQRTLAIRPDDVPALIGLGEAYLAAGRADAADAPFSRARALQPDSAAALYGLGRAAAARGDAATAVTLMERALAIEPAASAIHYPLSLAYRALGNAEAAERHLQQRGTVEIRRIDPLMDALDELLESAEAYEVRGMRALGRNDLPAAIDDFRRGVELAPDEPLMRTHLATALAVSGDSAAARDEFETVLRKNPRFVRAHLGLAVLLETSGDRALAIRHLSDAVRYDPEYAEGHLRLAQILRQSSRSSEALPHFKRAAELAPANEEARRDYEDALRRSGR